MTSHIVLLKKETGIFTFAVIFSAEEALLVREDAVTYEELCKSPPNANASELVTLAKWNASVVVLFLKAKSTSFSATLNKFCCQIRKRKCDCSG